LGHVTLSTHHSGAREIVRKTVQAKPKVLRKPGSIANRPSVGASRLNPDLLFSFHQFRELPSFPHLHWTVVDRLWTVRRLHQSHQHPRDLIFVNQRQPRRRGKGDRNGKVVT